MHEAIDFRRLLQAACRNVFYMREFFLAYREQPKVQPLLALPHCSRPAGAGKEQESVNRHHPLQGKEPDGCGVCAAVGQEAHRCGLLPRRQALAQTTQGAAAQSCRDREAARGWGMNRAGMVGRIQENFEEIKA